MKALVYTGPEQLEMRDMPMPLASEGEALVRVSNCGICGSDMHAYMGHDERRPAPLILGHEVSGIVESGPEKGMRVTVNPLATCGKCEACVSGRNNLCAKRQIISMPPREGGFGEYIAIPVENLVQVPEHVSLEKAALAEPLACGWHGVRLAKRALDRPLDEARCMIIGGGAIGFGTALCLRAQGASYIVIVEPNAGRRERIESDSGFQTIEPEAAGKGNHDLVVDAVGYAGTRAQACEAVKPGGVIIHIGLGDNKGGIDTRRVTLQEITFIGTYTYTPQDFRETAQAIFDGSLGHLAWLEKRPLEEGAAAFSDIRNNRTSSPKIILSV